MRLLGQSKANGDLLWELGLATRPASVPGTHGEAKQLTLSLDPTVATPELRDLTPWEQMAADYRRTGLSVGVHPLTLLRPHLPEGTLRSDDLHGSSHSSVAYAGLAIARQRPSTANGIVFMLLEDECGQVNLIVPKAVYERHRAIVRNEPLLLAHGRYERVGENRNILVSSIETLGGLARRVAELDVGACAATRTPLRAPLSRRQHGGGDQRRLGRSARTRDRLEPEPRVGTDGRGIVACTLRPIVSMPSARRSRHSAAHAPRASPCPRSSGSVATLPSAATPHRGEWTWTPATQTSRPSLRIPTYRLVARSRARTRSPGTPPGRALRARRDPPRPAHRRLSPSPSSRSRRASASLRCGSARSTA